MEAQFLEIYNETIRDLLCSSTEPKKHDIKHINGKTIVTNATTSKHFCNRSDSKFSSLHLYKFIVF